MIEPAAAMAPQGHGLFALKRSGRFTYRMQWWAPLILAFWIAIGRVFVGSVFGWVALLGSVTMGPMLAVLLYVPAWITLADRDVRHVKTARFGYDIASYVLWGVLVLWGLFLPDGADGPPFGSAVTMWTGGAFTYEESAVYYRALLIVGAAVYVVAVGLAIAGATRPSRLVDPPPTAAGGRPAVVTVAARLWWGAIALEALLAAADIWMLAAWGTYGLRTFGAQMGVAIAIIIVGCIFVPRLRGGHLAPRWVLGAAAAVALGTTILDGSLTDGRWTFELVPVLLLVVATVLSFLPSATTFFRVPARASERGDDAQSAAIGEPVSPGAARTPADGPRPSDT